MRQNLFSLFVLFLLFPALLNGQVTVAPGVSAATLVTKLVGSGVVIINPTINCTSNAYGTFSGPSSLSFDSGIVLTNGQAGTIGPAIGAFGPATGFASTNNTTAGDLQLTSLAASPTFDACILEFDFKPAGDTIKFNYVFGSEEYGCCVCSGYNDVFAFYISGPGFSGPTNMAIVPGTTVPVCINSVNCSTGSLCTAMGPGAPYCAHYVNNSTGTSITYYGMTTTMQAIAAVTPCDTYHLKLAIADAGDHILDGGVFLKAGSLSSTGTHITPLGLFPADTTIGAQFTVRGCSPGKFIFSRPSPTAAPLTIHFSIAGTAINGYDYATIADSVIIPPYATTDTLYITPLTVPPTGVKTVKLSISGTYTYTCGGSTTLVSDTVQLKIFDAISPITGPTNGCMGNFFPYTDSMGGGTWTSTSTSVCTIGSTSGIAYGVSTGVTVISYGYLPVCAVTKSVTINPIPAAITGGGLICVGTSTTLSCTTGGGYWARSNGNAFVGSLTGIVTGVSVGTDTISYIMPTGCKSVFVVTVNPIPVPISGTTVICDGTYTLLTDASAGGYWSSAAPGIAIIGSTTGMLTGTSAGITVITYTLSPGCFTTTSVTVNPAPLPISGPSHFCVGSSVTLTDPSSGGVWSTSTPGVITIGSLTGTVTGVGAGGVIVSYTLLMGCYTTTYFVTDPLPTPIAGVFTLCAGDTTILYSTPTGGSWSSSLPSVASIGTYSGDLAGISAGTTVISYTSPMGCSVSATATINPTPPAIAGSLAVCNGLTTTLTNSMSGGAWISSDPSIADIDASTGLVTGMSLGSAIISYIMPSGCYTWAMVTVNSAPLPITGPSALCAGRDTTLSDLVPGGTWSSSLTGIATVNPSTGVYHGVSSGIATITYSFGAGCLATYRVTINPAPAPIAGTMRICAGGSTTLTDPSLGGIWSSSTPTVASIGVTTGFVIGGSSGVATITYLASGCSTVATFTVNPNPGSIAGSNRVCPGTSTTLTNSFAGGTWTSSAPSVATIGSSSGLLTGVVVGVATVNYTLPTGCFVTKPVTVNPIPGAISGPSTVCIGVSITLTNATSGGTWSRSSANVSVGSLTGVVTGLIAGTTNITYTLPTGCYIVKPITINAAPGAITGTMSVCPGSTTTLSSITPGGTWTSATTSVATIGSATGLVSGILPGTTVIGYSLGSGCSISATVTVNPVPSLYAVTGGGSYCVGGTGLHIGLSGSVPGSTYQLYLGTFTIGAPLAGTGSSLDFGLQTGAGTYTVLATNALGCTRAMASSAVISINPGPTGIGGPSAVCLGAGAALTTTPAGGVWSSSAPLTASIGSATGLVTALAIGTTNITYTLPTGCYATKVITVTSAPGPIVGASSVCAGSATTFTDAVPGGIWSSPSVIISVGSVTGVVTGVSAGTATITYSLGSGCIVSKSLTVLVSPAAITGTLALCAGTSTTLRDATIGGTWGSGSTGIASIGSTTGTVTSSGTGTALISYTVGTCAATATITINPMPAAITGAATLCVSSTAPQSDITPGGTWSASSPYISIGSVSGIVTGISAGSAVITYSIAGCLATRTVTVVNTPAITGPTTVCAGANITLSGTGSGTWSSGSGTVASVGSLTGIVSGATVGVAVITFTTGTGCLATRNVTVTPGPSPISGSAAVCVGSTITLSTLTTGGTWSSSNVSVAAMGSAPGSVTGVAAGTAVISYVVGSGCVAVKPITVNALPAAIGGTTSVCIGYLTTLTNATPGGTWSCTATTIATVNPVSGIVGGVGAGSAVVTYTTGAGCTAITTVTVNTPPVPIVGPSVVCMGSSVTETDASTGGTWLSSNPVIATVGSLTGIVTGVNTGYTVISYTTGTGCVYAKIVTVNLPPPGISGTSRVCVGSSVTLTDPAVGGTWSSSYTSMATVGSVSGIVSGISGGIVTISYNVSVGCTATYPVTVNSVPPITGIRNLCAWGDTVTVHDATSGGLYSSTLVTVANLGSGNARVTSSIPGYGTVTYTAPSGCTTSVPITVNPLPGPITGNYNICIGITSTLRDTMVGGRWTSSATTIATVGSATGTVSGVSAGTAYITYTLPTGCIVDTPIHVIPSPAGITGWGGTITIGTSTTYSNATPGGLWSCSNPSIAAIGIGSGTVTGLTAGVATISYTVGSGCPAVRTITVSALIGTKPGHNTPALTDITIVPNPNRGTFVIKGSLQFNNKIGETDVQIEVTDMLGRTIHTQKATTTNGVLRSEITLDNAIANGVYLLHLRTDDTRRVFHITVER